MTERLPMEIAVRENRRHSHARSPRPPDHRRAQRAAHRSPAVRRSGRRPQSRRQSQRRSADRQLRHLLARAQLDSARPRRRRATPGLRQWPRPRRPHRDAPRRSHPHLRNGFFSHRQLRLIHPSLRRSRRFRMTFTSLRNLWRILFLVFLAASSFADSPTRDHSH